MPAYLGATVRSSSSLVSGFARHVRRPATLLALSATLLFAAPSLPVFAADQHLRVERVTLQAPSPGSSYKIEAGDSLYSIAADLGISDAKLASWIEEFLALNGMDDPDMLTEGQTVKIPGTKPASSTPVLSTVSTQSSAGGSRSYMVQNGDTLYSIGANLNVPDDKLYQWVQDTMALNDMEVGDHLTAGKTIQISTRNVPVPKPITSTYTVKAGDTLYDIAAKTNVPESGVTGWMALVLELNGLTSPDTLREGQALQLPVTSGGSTTTTTTTSSVSTTSGPSPTSQNVSLTRPATTVSYTVKPGDTLEAIGIAQKVPDTQLRSWIEDVRKLNKLNDDGFITEGQKLDLPATSVTPPAASTTTSSPPPPPPAASTTSNSSTSTTTTTTTSQSSSGSGSGTSPALANAPRSMTGCFYVIKPEDDLTGIAKKVGIEPGNVSNWIAQVKQMNGVDFKVMPVGTAIQMPC